MDTLKAMRLVIERSGMTQREVAAKVGRTQGSLTGYLSRGSLPSVPIFAEIVGACGYDVAVVPHGSKLPEGSIEVR